MGGNEEDREQGEQPAEGEAQDTSESTREEIERFRQLIAEREGLLRRIQADFENSLKRTQREIERAEHAAEMRTVKRLLPLLDTIDAGLGAETEGSDAHRTLSMVRGSLTKTLGELGVTEIEAEKVPFDSDLHEALMTRPGEDGVVLEVVQKGYRYGEAVLRHAKVIVGRGDRDESGSEAKRSDRS